MTLALRCLACEEDADIVVETSPTGLITITCTQCREISFLQVAEFCTTCLWRMPDHKPGCPNAPDQQLWGV